MKRTVDRKAGNDQMLMLVLAIVLCVTALWAIGCGGADETTPHAVHTDQAVLV